MLYKNLIIKLLLAIFMIGINATGLASEKARLIDSQNQRELDLSISEIVNNIYQEINTNNFWTYPDAGAAYSTGSEHWHVKNQEFFLAKNVQLTQAVDSIFKFKAQLDCSAAQAFVSLRLYIVLLGKENFSKLMEINDDNSLMNISDKYRRIFDPLNRDRFLQNISVYFGYIKNNELYSRIYNGFYQGYNIIRLSNGMFQGFGTFFSEPRSYREIRDMFYDQFRKVPTKNDIEPKYLREWEEINKDRNSFDAYFNLCNFDIYLDIKNFPAYLDGENIIWENMEKKIKRLGLEKEIRTKALAGSHVISLDVLRSLITRSQN